MVEHSKRLTITATRLTSDRGQSRHRQQTPLNADTATAHCCSTERRSAASTRTRALLLGSLCSLFFFSRSQTGTTTRLRAHGRRLRPILRAVRASFLLVFSAIRHARSAGSRGAALPAWRLEDTPSWESARRGDSQGGHPALSREGGTPLNGSLNGETNADFFVAASIQDAAQEGPPAR